MATLTIDLQEGFANETIVLRANGAEVFKKESVSTKLLFGFAESISIEIAESIVRVEIEALQSGLEKSVSLEAENDVYLGFSIVAGGIEHIVADRPFGYG